MTAIPQWVKIQPYETGSSCACRYTTKVVLLEYQLPSIHLLPKQLDTTPFVTVMMSFPNLPRRMCKNLFSHGRDDRTFDSHLVQ